MLFAIVYYYPPPSAPTISTIIFTHHHLTRGLIVLAAIVSALTTVYNFSDYTLEDITLPQIPWNHILKKNKPTYDISPSLQVYVDASVILPAYFMVFTALQLRSMFYYMYRMPTVFIQQCITKILMNPLVVLALLVHGTYFNLLYCTRLYYFDGVQIYQTYNTFGNFIRTIERTLGPRGRNRALLFAKNSITAAWQTYISCLSYLCLQLHITYQKAMTHLGGRDF